MVIFHIGRLPAVLLGVFVAFTACQKETVLTETDKSIEQPATDLCPDLSNLIEKENAAVSSELLLQYFSPTELLEVRTHTCLTRMPESGGVDSRASGQKNAYWTPGTTIRVRFLNGSVSLQNRVMYYAKQWETYANIHFQQVSSGASDVRVLFGEEGHWSYIGTGNRYVDACEKTMALELKDNTGDTEVGRVALHEFGHVLGMLHEHQQPLASIPWNTEKVYAYYAQQDWSRTDVDEQVLNKNNTLSTQYTEFDATSIMEYPVSASLTTTGYAIGWNTRLSAADKTFIGLMYGSQRIQVRHAVSGYSQPVTFRLAGIYHTLKAGESIQAPALSSGNQLGIKEISGIWDETYKPVTGKKYKLVRVGAGNDFTLAAD